MFFSFECFFFVLKNIFSIRNLDADNFRKQRPDFFAKFPVEP